MRVNRGFTLIELAVVVAIIAIVGALVVLQGRSARHNAQVAGGAYELALRIGGLRARAMSDVREHVLVVADTSNPAGCKVSDLLCGRLVVLKSPDDAFQPTFQGGGFNPDAPAISGEMEVVDDGASQRVVRNTRFDLGSDWRPPPPFRGVAAFDSNVLLTCTDGRRCFAIRFLPDGEVRPVMKPGASVPAGFAFVFSPIDAPSGGAERRAIFVSFPTGLVKTAAF